MTILWNKKTTTAVLVTAGIEDRASYYGAQIVELLGQKAVLFLSF